MKVLSTIESKMREGGEVLWYLFTRTQQHSNNYYDRRTEKIRAIPNNT